MRIQFAVRHHTETEKVLALRQRGKKGPSDHILTHGLPEGKRRFNIFYPLPVLENDNGNLFIHIGVALQVLLVMNRHIQGKNKMQRVASFDGIIAALKPDFGKGPQAAVEAVTYGEQRRLD